MSNFMLEVYDVPLGPAATNGYFIDDTNSDTSSFDSYEEESGY